MLRDHAGDDRDRSWRRGRNCCLERIDMRQVEQGARGGSAEQDCGCCDFAFHGCFSRVGSFAHRSIVLPADRPGTVFGTPVMFGIPEMASAGAATATVFDAGGVMAGTVGTVAAIVLTVGATAMVGTTAAELTPRLPISVEPIGMPVRITPPGATGEVGIDDAARLPEPAPHMLDIPDVSIRADVGEMLDDDIADDIGAPAIGIVDIVLCGVTAPTATPPPSKVVAEPNIVDGAVPTVEHTVLPIVPVAAAGIGLTPGDAISVAPSGMPVPPTGALGTMPSGEVAASEGVGITWAC